MNAHELRPGMLFTVPNRHAAKVAFVDMIISVVQCNKDTTAVYEKMHVNVLRTCRSTQSTTLDISVTAEYTAFYEGWERIA